MVKTEEKKENSLRKKNDIRLIVVILIIAAIAFLVLIISRRNGAQVVIRVDGKETASFPLNQNTTYTIEGADGGTNQLIIQDGQAWFSEADCPDKLCVKMGKIRYDGETIVCLPHKVVAEIEGGKKSGDGVDAKSGGVDGHSSISTESE